VNTKQSPPQQPSLLLVPICIVRCPQCSHAFSFTCENLNTIIPCPSCKRKFFYIDGFLNHYRRHPGIFIDQVHPIPIAPGFTIGGEIQIIPNEIQAVYYGVTYNRPPQLFFLNDQNLPARDLLVENLYVAAVSISTDNFILLSRILDPGREIPECRVRWLSIGEIGVHEKPIWISILQNAADLILKEEERAALVMLQTALDFFLDSNLEQLNLDYRDVKTAARRWKISDRRARIRLLERHYGSFPRRLTTKLIDLAEQRNRIVHGRITRPEARDFSGAEAFELILDTITSINDLKYAYFQREDVEPDGKK